MMQEENIVCFAKDWSEDPTSNNHVMRELARRNKVLWLNSIATRVPKLSSSGDMSKIVRKLKSFAKGPEHIENGLDVYTPIVVPLLDGMSLSGSFRGLGFGKFGFGGNSFLSSSGLFSGYFGSGGFGVARYFGFVVGFLFLTKFGGAFFGEEYCFLYISFQHTGFHK